jgi:hypothetical protein
MAYSSEHGFFLSKPQDIKLMGLSWDEFSKVHGLMQTNIQAKKTRPC